VWLEVIDAAARRRLSPKELEGARGCTHLPFSSPPSLCCHHPPPGLAFGEPKDRLRRMIK
jgi:hypothetical protein